MKGKTKNKMKLSFSESDLLASTQLEGGWYVLEVKAISDWKKGKNDPESNNIEADFVVVGPKNVGVPIRHWFSEKVIGTSRDRLGQFMGCFTPEGKAKAGVQYEHTETVGRKCEGYVYWNDQMSSNSIKDFRRYQGVKASA